MVRVLRVYPIEVDRPQESVRENVLDNSIAIVTGVS